MKLIVREAESGALGAAIPEGADVVTSVVSIAEVTRALRVAGLVADTEVEGLAHVLDGVALVDTDVAIARVAAGRASESLRPLDAIHLGTAIAVAPDVSSSTTAGSRSQQLRQGSPSTRPAPTSPDGDAYAAAMRIIAGERRGARIAAPKGDSTRPTGDRVREAAYNLIGPVEGAAVLDLFAGSGAMGLEALSRGARRCVFVESDRAACAVIRGNLEKLRLTGALVLQRDVFQALREERGAGRTHDLVLVDPPYGAWPELQPRLAEALPAALAPDGLLVVETSARVEPELPLALVTSRRYGSARISIFTR